MKTRVILSIAAVALGLLIAAVPQNTTRPYKVNPEQMLAEIKGGQQFISPEEVADMIVQKDPLIQLIDVRNADEYAQFSLPGAISIPLESILNEEFDEVLNQDVKTNILYSNGNMDANEAWMLLRQLGYKNNYVLMGGLNYWFEAIMNPANPGNAVASEEIARYNFRKAAGAALGSDGSGLSADSSAGSAGTPKPMPVKTEKKKRKPVAGGCS
jgi:rhodanese-related sulfurtransferase